MPIGNGTLGAAVWAANGFTAQLNRNDTFPDRKSPGWLTIPGLSAMSSAANYKGVLDIYNGTFTQSGGGITAVTYIDANSDQIVVDVTGLAANVAETAQLSLWSPRTPTQSLNGSTGILAEQWVDNGETGATNPGGASGQTFGSLAALTAVGQNVTASKVNTLAVQVSFTTNSDGSFRVIAASPHWAGGTTAQAATAAAAVIGTPSSTDSTLTAHTAWWNTFWANTGTLKITSTDGTTAGEYYENLRTLYLYDAAASSRSTLPGSQAGYADDFSFNQDSSLFYDPAAYWQWNLRMMVSANLGASATSLTDSYFNLYTSNVANLQAWTTAQWSTATTAAAIMNPNSKTATSPSGLCFDLVGSSTAVNTALDINECATASTTQKWSFNPTTLAITSNSGLCLDGSASNVVVKACSGLGGQQWTFNANGSITLASGSCLDVTYGYKTAGSTIGTYGCSTPPSSNQTFTTSLKSYGEGICVPETMRFNGKGYENEYWGGGAAGNCVNKSNSGAYYNARTLSTGAEVGLWVWERYQLTGDAAFLKLNYPVMAQSAAFLLNYATVNATTGKLQTSPSNAHETQWDVTDPSTDVAAMKALFPAVVAAANILGTTSASSVVPGNTQLISDLTTAIPKIRAFPTKTVNGNLVIAYSGTDATAFAGGKTKSDTSNYENIGLEPLWPYGVINSTQTTKDPTNKVSDFALEQQSFANRDFVHNQEWSADAIDAALLGDPTNMQSSLKAIVDAYQAAPSGLYAFFGTLSPVSAQNGVTIESGGIITTALQDALAQSDSGTLQIAPAWPTNWDADGSVAIKGGMVDIQVRSGVATTVIVAPTVAETISVQNPWNGSAVQVLDESNSAQVVVASTTANTFILPMVAGHFYDIERTAIPLSGMSFQKIDGAQATTPKTFGTRTIGIAAAAPASTANSISTVIMNPASNTSTSPSGLCFDLVGSSTAVNTALDIAECATGSATQKWAFNPSAKTITSSGGLCLDGSGSPIVANTCSGIAGQKWVFNTNGSIALTSGSCVDVTYGYKAAGSTVGVYGCSTTPSGNQLFTATASITNLNSKTSSSPLGLCFDLVGSSTAPNTALDINECTSGSATQKWKFNAATKAITGSAGICLDGSNPSSIVANTCSGSAGQQWSFSANGSIKLANGSCMDVTNGYKAAGSTIGTYSCSTPSSGNQTFSSVVAP